MDEAALVEEAEEGGLERAHAGAVSTR
jgi:hypothetical protein